MSLEIERKWLLQQALPESWERLLQEKVETVYYSKDPEVRFRKRGEREAVVTLKLSRDDPLAREELEMPIDFASYDRLTKGEKILSRDDLHLRLPTGEVLEVSYIPDLDITYAEIEFPSLEQAKAFKPPFDWGEEVTGQAWHSFYEVYQRWLRRPFEQLYYHDPEVGEAEVEVLAVDGNKVKIEPQLFFPESGGQPGDQGRLGPWQVRDTQLIDGQAILIMEADAEPIENKTYEARIDLVRRQHFRRQHTAEHLLMGYAHRLYGMENSGFHMNEDYFTMDLDRRLSKEEIQELERLGNQGVRANMPVRSHCGFAADFTDLHYRSKKDFTGPLRLIEIEGHDLCACSALHAQSTGEIGLIRILDETGVRGGSRLTVCVGDRAVDEVQEHLAVASYLAKAKSCQITDLPERLENEAKQNKDLQEQYSELLDAYIEQSIKGINGKTLLIILDQESKGFDAFQKLLETFPFEQTLVLKEQDPEKVAYLYKLYDQTSVEDALEKLEQHAKLFGGHSGSLAQGRLEFKEDEDPEGLGYENILELKIP